MPLPDAVEELELAEAMNAAHSRWRDACDPKSRRSPRKLESIPHQTRAKTVAEDADKMGSITPGGDDRRVLDPRLNCLPAPGLHRCSALGPKQVSFALRAGYNGKKKRECEPHNAKEYS